MAQRSVSEIIGIKPDLTPETLPLVDQYLRQLRSPPKRGQSKAKGVAATVKPPLHQQPLVSGTDSGASTNEEVVELVLAAVGCYFGEVLRQKLHGRWILSDQESAGDPRTWRIGLVNCLLHFRPVGMAGDVYYRGSNERYDGSFATLDRLQDPLADMLANASPFTDDEYYSLACRVDVMELVADWLLRQNLAHETPRHTYTVEDYKTILKRQA